MDNPHVYLGAFLVCTPKVEESFDCVNCHKPIKKQYCPVCGAKKQKHVKEIPEIWDMEEKVDPLSATQKETDDNHIFFGEEKELEFDEFVEVIDEAMIRRVTHEFQQKYANQIKILESEYTSVKVEFGCLGYIT